MAGTMAKTLSLISYTALSGVVADDAPIRVDMYRGMGKRGVSDFTEENDDLADLMGVIKYIHTETIAEHTLAPPTRETRKNGIDVIARYRMKVKNSDELQSSKQYSAFVDFGHFLAFDNGQQTAAELGDLVVSQYGDYVGIQDQSGDARYPTKGPFYWYSITGFCPNLPWHCTRGWEGCINPSPPSIICTEEHPCPGKGTKDHPSDQCLTYTDGNVVQGGLCANGADPTGQKGCVYSYKAEEASTINLDDLVGITNEDCGGEKCKDWLDFRRRCTNTALKRQFNPTTKEIMNQSFCVEYDIHPDCLGDCHTDKCKAVPADQRELGLPFWSGRCDALRNQERAEAVAEAFGISDATSAHALVEDDIKKSFRSCATRLGGGTCTPDSATGGPYCSRAWTGVCTPCYVPGASASYPANATQPPCPMDILEGEDYGPMSSFMKPLCKSTRPRDWCCLYEKTCTGELDPAKAPLNPDGLAVVLASRSTDNVLAYFSRLARDSFGPYPKDESAARKLAYESWSINARPDVDFDALNRTLRDYYTTVKPPTPSSGGQGSAVVGIVVGVLAVVGLVGAGAVLLRRRRRVQQARNQMLLGQA
eukprot:TRINITY_DN13953_c0_g1_i1.p1 TRINITY_DN13953_c0_g1~~TRINITY_DN13953_c0_g1_i1.p1  ORF type:complete len:593 (-),score=105.79 TRINITY_DN13953_c0_g1_i1:185-1963(-)